MSVETINVSLGSNNTMSASNPGFKAPFRLSPHRCAGPLHKYLDKTLKSNPRAYACVQNNDKPVQKVR